MNKSSVSGKCIPGAAYIRYSSDMQNDSFSLDAQLRQIHHRAEGDGVTIVKVFSDPATSAYSKKHRPGISEMLDSGQRREFNILYVHKVDRLARRLEWALEIVHKLQALNITFKAVEQNFDLGTPEGKLFFHLLSSLGEFYSDNLSKETLKGKRERARQGYHNGWVSWGYISEKRGNQKMAVKDPKLAPIVQDMFERYGTGAYSDRQIADWMNDQGYRTRRGRLFSKDTVREMLQNPFYNGYVRYRGSFQKGKPYRSKAGEIIKGVHEPIVSEELWEYCQSVRASRRRSIKTRQVTRRVYLVNGLIACSHCGRRLRAQSSTRTRYYREVSRENGFDDCPVAGQSIQADLIDAKISRIIQSINLPGDWKIPLKVILQEAGEGETLDSEAERKKLWEKLRELRELKRRGLYEGEEHLFWREVENLQEQLTALERIPSSNLETAITTLLSIKSIWTHATLEEQRDLVQMILEEVVCDLSNQKLLWVKPRAGYEILFKIIPGLISYKNGRFDIRDI